MTTYKLEGGGGGVLKVTEAAREILGKHHQKKKPLVTAEILDLCNKRRELRKKRLEPEGSY